MDSWARLALGAVVLVAIAVALLTWFGTAHARAAIPAVSRAAVQLAVVAIVLHAAITTGWLVGVIVAVMFTVAVGTAARRLTDIDHAVFRCAASCGVGATVTIGLIVGAGVLDRDSRTLVAVSGIVIGGCMTAATLTGRRLTDGMRSNRDEIEGWLAIGAPPRRAVLDTARTAVTEALIPGLDQTRTVGLVTLPGAFVGALIAGADATQAARFQFIVLTGLVCAQALTSVTLAILAGEPRTLPAVAEPR
ncbi:ABC transporter permease [Williamsia deligens]|uniref:ABC transporter permease n=1 Tax=Williamsia deligens TaxID=321325 RepID=A0ABW3G938_9NOCA|nr:ABC transporter permease [Williamsia deligens]MCP2192556.1 putative ABC transport system permease protein [Williamsia deligens]